MTSPTLALALAYWLHMLATVVWIGGLATLAILALPAAQRTLDDAAFSAFLADLQRRLDPLAWFSLLLLAGTGMFQMSASPNYQGFLAIDNPWAVAILVKHIAFLGMAGLSAYLTWGLLPRMQRSLLRSSRGAVDTSAAAETQALQRQQVRLLRLNLALGVLVLALTAIARSL